MKLKYNPEPGTILICNYSMGSVKPEMTKKRPVIAISPKFKNQRPGLCTVVPLSTTAPRIPQPYHYKIIWDRPLPAPYDKKNHSWVKGDMIATVSWQRLSLPFKGKDPNGKRIYDIRVLKKEQLDEVKKCILNALGMETLTKMI